MAQTGVSVQGTVLYNSTYTLFNVKDPECLAIRYSLSRVTRVSSPGARRHHLNHKNRPKSKESGRSPRQELLTVYHRFALQPVGPHKQTNRETCKISSPATTCRPRQRQTCKSTRSARSNSLATSATLSRKSMLQIHLAGM